jgi:alpha-L-fucosidase
VAATPARRDLVAEFVEAFSAEGLKVGLYYALLDRHCPFYEDDARYAEYVREQVQELLTGYGEVLELWFDGAWDKDHPTRDWPHDPAWAPSTGARWEWTRLYEHIHRLQPRCLVIQNSSSDRPGVPNYLPVDARTSEHFDFVWQERLCAPRLDPQFPSANGSLYLPLEYCTTLTPGWFWQAGACYSHASAEAIAGWRLRAERQRANLLINLGPDTSGRIPDYHKSFLVDADRLVRAGHLARP